MDTSQRFGSDLQPYLLTVRTVFGYTSFSFLFLYGFTWEGGGWVENILLLEGGYGFDGFDRLRFVINYRHSFLGFHDQMVVFHRQRDDAAVQVRFVRVSETIVRRTIVQQRRQQRSVRRRVTTDWGGGVGVVGHQHGVLRFAGLELKKKNDIKLKITKNITKRKKISTF